MASQRPKNDKRNQEKRRRRLRRLYARGEPNPWSASPTIPVAPAGMEKMSEVLERFIEPYMTGSAAPETELDLRKLLTVAVLAWDIANLSPDQQKAQIDQIIREGVSHKSDADQRLFRTLVEDMIDRKNTHFSTINRTIISFDVRFTGHGYDLTVVSLIKMPPRS